jgi:hypothetical protein
MDTQEQEKDIGAINIWGRKYDLGLVVETAEYLIDELVQHYGSGRISIRSFQRHGQRHEWPSPGRDFARLAWKRLSTIFDAADEALIVTAGRISIVAYLLGTARVILNGKMGMLTTQDGRPVHNLVDPAPALCLYGRDLGSGRLEFLDRGLVDAVGRLLSLRHESLEIRYGCQEAEPDSGRYAAILAFPHRVYGAGEGLIRTRCIVPEGHIEWIRDG